MKISSKKELRFVLQADMMMNRGKYKSSMADYLKGFFFPDYIMNYLVAMRKVSYYGGTGGILDKIRLLYYYRLYRILGLKLGFSIGCDTLGYGVVIPHYGTIVVGHSNKIGNYAVLHTSTCISDNGKVIGDGLYLSTGVKITTKNVLGNYISIGANSLVNRSYEKNNLLIGGIPAGIIKDKYEPWYIRDEYEERVQKVEDLRKELGINL